MLVLFRTVTAKFFTALGFTTNTDSGLNGSNRQKTDLNAINVLITSQLKNDKKYYMR